MTDHYFENSFIKLHYYEFGTGPEIMLCFHGYGMHGRQFKILEDTSLALKYTFIGFDLFFHKQTKLKDQSLGVVKKGITKKDFARLIDEFCRFRNIDRFSVMGYSMGSHYATVMVEERATRVKEYIVAAPSCLNPGLLVTFFSKNPVGNKMIEKIALSERALLNLLKFCKRLRVLDNEGYAILKKEINTEELRFNFYACLTYLRFFETDEQRLKGALDKQNIKSIFIFGKRDKGYPAATGKAFIEQIKHAEVILLDETHEMITQNFVSALSTALL